LSFLCIRAWVYELHGRTAVADHGESPRTRFYAPSDHQPIPRFEHVQWTWYGRESVRAHEHRQVCAVLFRFRFPVYCLHGTMFGILTADQLVDEFRGVLVAQCQALQTTGRHFKYLLQHAKGVQNVFKNGFTRVCAFLVSSI